MTLPKDLREFVELFLSRNIEPVIETAHLGDVAELERILGLPR